MNTSPRCRNLSACRTTLGIMLMLAAPATARAESVLQKVLRTHVLSIGTLSGNPPWEFTTPSGELDGYDIAIGKAIAADLGAKAEFVQTSGAGRIPALQTHKVDLVLGELDYTPQRAQTIAYTMAYATPASEFLVKSD
jgi:polar amino acid transport system substrate-binding protein